MIKIPKRFDTIPCSMTTGDHEIIELQVEKSRALDVDDQTEQAIQEYRRGIAA